MNKLRWQLVVTKGSKKNKKSSFDLLLAGSGEFVGEPTEGFQAVMAGI